MNRSDFNSASPLVAIVARQHSMRQELQGLIEGLGRFRVAGAVANSAELSVRLPFWRPDIVLWDYDSNDRAALLSALILQNIALVVLCEPEHPWQELLDAPLHGRVFVLRNASETKIAVALEAALAAFTAWDSDLEQPTKNLPTTSPLEEDDAQNTLTNREREVLQLMAYGLPNKQIASRLGISLSTVKFHVASILEKLHVESRTEAVTEGIRRGLVSL
ncbi:two component transcriptional regulator, LuxR family [Chthonomonas calidirosea]|uniref:Two component transcriptional regulator, LuxR family n=1 Tax=Chthonomonas calidirosea (strain DSM 23976 / ICMP 18418 / T49) TaxID=1303518 RepID=S0ETQ8_CHTCT|nr:response regulator transcription factor [Chthonomonas calidirosea]CCW34873.1 two component transcriptional regulator, LuxR family [Chthonomonas calidirosea T49]CEK12594.1 two component transcriptional regulator, LuxR family [Chthonomonas calidirosea]CEK12595.1 two component transcriptional regulator, LuxR family [Chthonomonas calidirosea]CEK13550.1 two component transcriptional regulator, LuxR family [Chthonomonas calidirosea]